jgi:two-component system, chemotaxis family, protein-glutamate methylesterase/glutaminase
MSRVVRVLVVDDSAYVRKVVRQMLSRSPFIEVVGVARDGLEALELVEQLEPDVVTCDLIMPQMDGPAFVREQMRRRPLPILVMSVASETAGEALAALEAGAVDFLRKPTALATEKIFEISDDLIEKVKMAASIPVSRLAPAVAPEAEAEPPATARGEGRADVVVLGISTGGPQALRHLVPQLPADLGVPVVIVMHMPVGYTEMYAARLDQVSPLAVREARNGEVLRPGTVLLAPAGMHLTLRRSPDGSVLTRLDVQPLGLLFRPSVDVLFRSAAEAFPGRALGVVMTGMGSDGVQGAAWIKAKGGLIFTEAEETCIVYGMPRAICEAGLSDRAVPLGRMARAVVEVV